jgi:hypothetical protein
VLFVLNICTSFQLQIETEALVVPKKYKPFTDHSSDGMFGRVYLKLAGKLAREEIGLRLHMRLFLVGLQRVSNRGHAPFKTGELAELLVRENGSSYTDKYIRNEIALLANAGLLSPESNIRCLLYPMELILLKTEKKNAAECPEHGTHSSWSLYNRDWAPDNPPDTQVEEVIVPLVESVEDISDEMEEFYSRIEGTYGS